jgi:hypothetical protein
MIPVSIYHILLQNSTRGEKKRTDLGIHAREQGGEVVEVGLPAAVRGAAGPLGRMVVGVRGGRGRREEVVGEDGGGPLATDYRRHGAPRLLLLLVLLALPLAADAVLLPASAAHPLPSPAAASPPLDGIGLGWWGGLGSRRRRIAEAEAEAELAMV